MKIGANDIFKVKTQKTRCAESSERSREQK